VDAVTEPGVEEAGSAVDVVVEVVDVEDVDVDAVTEPGAEEAGTAGDVEFLVSVSGGVVSLGLGSTISLTSSM
jgi:hypothetical protein